MNDNAKLWVEALRSGKYKQGRGLLAQDNCGTTEYCCLGVACDLYEKQAIGLKLNPVLVDGEYHFHDPKLDIGHASFLPEIVQDWLGLRDRHGDYRDAGGIMTQSLADLNDTGHSFDEIASVIESEPEGLFLC